MTGDVITDDWFRQWAELHCEATAAGADALAALLANRDIFVDDWAATPAELGECTRRLALNLRVPKFANDHHEAVARELMALRRERDDAARQALRDESAAAEAACRVCRDTGLATVPHWRCVEVPRHDPPRVVSYRDPATVGDYGRVVEASVRCECPAGRALRGGHLTLRNYLGLIGGALSAAAVVELLARFRRSEADAVRERPVFDGRLRGAAAVAGSVGEVIRNTAQGDAA